MADIEKLIDVFMHMGDHIQNLDEYGLCYDSTLAEAIEDVVEMLKNEEIRGNPRKSEWIPATERLPEEGKWVLCLKNGRWHWLAIWNPKEWTDGEFWEEETVVTHWMPLPEPPKERNDG